MAHPGWTDLIQLFEERKQKYILEFGHKLTSSPQPADQRDIDRAYGRWAGVREVLGEPARAEKALRKEIGGSR